MPMSREDKTEIRNKNLVWAPLTNQPVRLTLEKGDDSSLYADFFKQIAQYVYRCSVR